jgi:Flp pilus assembly protein TadG
MKRRRSSSRGQIVIPAAFLFPTLMLFVFLLFETAKLSREKIRHQFAADAAVFVEMTNYSDFLNRSAYVNGAFPMRIFYEGFNGTSMPCTNGTSSNCPANTTLDELLYADGDFPRDPSTPNPNTYMNEAQNLPSWNIQYGGARSSLNVPDPDTDGISCSCPTCSSGATANSCLTLISEHDAQFYPLNWDDSNQVYRLYVQIFQLLGSVESAQYQVLQRLTVGTQKHNFLQKSYWLNVGGDNAIGEAALAAANFSGGNDSGFNEGSNGVTFHCIKSILFYGNTVTVQNLMQHTFVVASDPIPSMPTSIPDCGASGSQGTLFQMVTVNQATMQSMQFGQNTGWDATFDWHPPATDYFSVNLASLINTGTGLPEVHATAFVDGFGGSGGRNQPSVWPNPTPKFQVRSYP